MASTLAKQSSGSEYARIASQIKKRRKELGMSQRELALAAGLKQATISRLESSTWNPEIKTLEKLSDALGLKVKIYLVDE
ncbi:hypothetical protein J6TS7_32260 [Paenibacillus dendritiformis]|uniref:helix-turn-helix domain-containing protein n=1 Tax=Paenibacillus TaxID=44249 RepID=UPI001B0C536E|nr:helix-turn-helix transcriptional regulator [Paenibacillus dendritiformis]GIO79616.1 hypothetical protein J6TS7_32260 [Paenibacillus dendritiformis]